jgi:hypothetical protein
VIYPRQLILLFFKLKIVEIFREIKEIEEKVLMNMLERLDILEVLLILKEIWQEKYLQSLRKWVPALI